MGVPRRTNVLTASKSPGRSSGEVSNGLIRSEDLLKGGASLRASRALAAAATAGGGPVQLAEFSLPSPQKIRPIDLSDAIPASRLNPYSWRQPGPTPGCWRILDLHPYILPVHPRARAARAAAHARHPQVSARASARAHITSALLTSYRRLIQRWIYGHYGFSLNPSTPRS